MSSLSHRRSIRHVLVVTTFMLALHLLLELRPVFLFCFGDKDLSSRSKILRYLSYFNFLSLISFVVLHNQLHLRPLLPQNQYTATFTFFVYFLFYYFDT